MGKYDDLFDTAPSPTPAAEVGKYSDLFDEPEVVAEQQQPEGGNGLVAKINAALRQPSPDWLQAPEQAARELVTGMVPHDIPSYLKSITGPVGMAYDQASGLARGDVSSIPFVGRVPEIMAAEDTPAGSKERYLAAMKTLMDVGMLAGAGGERVPSPLRGEPLAPEPPPTVSMGPGTIAGDVSRAMERSDRRLTTLAPEQSPEQLADTIRQQETQSRLDAINDVLNRRRQATEVIEPPVPEEPHVSPETGFVFHPEPQAPVDELQRVNQMLQQRADLMRGISGEVSPESQVVEQPVAAPEPVLTPKAQKTLAKLKAHKATVEGIGGQVDPKVTAKIAEIEGKVQGFRGEPKGPSAAGQAHGVGTYYGLSEDVAQRFSKEGTVKSSDLNLQNPFTVSSDAELRAIRTEAGVNPDPRMLLSPNEAEQFTEHLRNKGHDSFVTNYNEAPGGRQAVVFPEPPVQAQEAPTVAPEAPGGVPVAGRAPITEMFSAKGATDALYQKAFDALRAGKDTISGVRDPILARHKAAFDRGEIRSWEDLKVAEEGKGTGGITPEAAARAQEGPVQAPETPASASEAPGGVGGAGKVTVTAILDKRTGEIHVAQPGELHPQIFKRLEDAGASYGELIKGFETGDLVNGFVDDSGRFLDRKQARDLAGKSSQVYDWSGQALHGESLTKEAPGDVPVVEPAPATPQLEIPPEDVKYAGGEPVPQAFSEEPHVSSIANRFTAERAAAGELGEIAPGESVNTMDLVHHGLKMSPEKVNESISRIMQGGDVPINDAAAIRGEEARLSQRSGDLSRAARANPSPEAQLAADNAFKDLTDFHNGPVAQAKRNWHHQGKLMQGEIPVDLSTLNGMREAWLKDTGKPPPAHVEPKLQKAADKLAKAIDEEQAAARNGGDAIEKATRARKLPTPEEVRNNIADRMKVEPCII